MRPTDSCRASTDFACARILLAHFRFMRICFFGTRGVPARYSGFEQFVEQVGVRLVQRGHEVIVYNRTPFNKFKGKEFNGIRLVRLPTLPFKYTDTIVHTALSVAHSLTRRYDIAYFCGVGNALMAIGPKAAGRKTLVNVDGADYARAKWSGFGRWWLHRSETWAARLADMVIADNRTIQARYRDLYHVDAEYVSYGANIVTEDPGTDALRQYGLQSGGYFLYVSRLTPENAADLTIEAYLQCKTALPLVVVGDAPYQENYKARLRELAAKSPAVFLAGYQFGEAYRQLSFHARAFILPTAIDATRPVLLDQMGFGNCIIARDTPGNVEVLGEDAIYFADASPRGSLAEALRIVATDPLAAQTYGQRALARVSQHYNWDTITARYEALFAQLCRPN